MSTRANLGGLSRFSEAEARTIGMYVLRQHFGLALDHPPSLASTPLRTSVTIITPSCFHRTALGASLRKTRVCDFLKLADPHCFSCISDPKISRPGSKWHSNLYAMMAHQDYLGPIEFIVADGECGPASLIKRGCKVKGSAPSAFLMEKMQHDSRLKYYSLPAIDTTVNTLGQKRNWLIANASGDIVLHFDDDDYYAPHYVRTMVAMLSITGVDFVKLMSWITYGTTRKHPQPCSERHYHADVTGLPCARQLPAGTTFKSTPVFTRLPVLQWEKQDGLGWAFSYTFTKSFGARQAFSPKDSSEEQGFVRAFRKFAVQKASWAAVPDIFASAMRIVTWYAPCCVCANLCRTQPVLCAPESRV